MKDDKERKTRTCFQIRLCSASAYLICPAFAEGLNCWETDKKICCRRNAIERCRKCEVYLLAQGFTREEIRKILLEIESAPEYNASWHRGQDKGPTKPEGK